MLITQSVHGFAIKRHDFRYRGLHACFRRAARNSSLFLTRIINISALRLSNYNISEHKAL